MNKTNTKSNSIAFHSQKSHLYIIALSCISTFALMVLPVLDAANQAQLVRSNTNWSNETANSFQVTASEAFKIRSAITYTITVKNDTVVEPTTDSVNTDLDSNTAPSSNEVVNDPTTNIRLMVVTDNDDEVIAVRQQPANGDNNVFGPNTDIMTSGVNTNEPISQGDAKILGIPTNETVNTGLVFLLDDAALPTTDVNTTNLHPGAPKNAETVEERKQRLLQAVDVAKANNIKAQKALDDFKALKVTLYEQKVAAEQRMIDLLNMPLSSQFAGQLITGSSLTGNTSVSIAKLFLDTQNMVYQAQYQFDEYLKNEAEMLEYYNSLVYETSIQLESAEAAFETASEDEIYASSDVTYGYSGSACVPNGTEGPCTPPPCPTDMYTEDGSCLPSCVLTETC